MISQSPEALKGEEALVQEGWRRRKEVRAPMKPAFSVRFSPVSQGSSAFPFLVPHRILQCLYSIPVLGLCPFTNAVMSTTSDLRWKNGSPLGLNLIYEYVFVLVRFTLNSLRVALSPASNHILIGF